MGEFLNPRVEMVFRELFCSENNRELIVNFINDIKGFSDNEKIETLEFLPPIYTDIDTGVNPNIFSFLCTDKSGKNLTVRLQLVANDKPDCNYNNAQYYVADAYHNSLCNLGLYSKIREVILISITDQILFKNKPSYKSEHVVLDKNSYEQDLREFSFVFIELPKFKKNKIEELITPLEKWCYFFKYADKTYGSDVVRIAKNDMNIRTAFHIARKSRWSDVKLSRYEQCIESFKGANYLLPGV